MPDGPECPASRSVADIMGDDLDTVPFAVGLSRAARRVIRQNVAVSLGAIVLYLFRRYREHFLPTVSAEERRYAGSVLGMFERLLDAASPAMVIGDAECT